MLKHICLTIISALIIGCAQKQSSQENGETSDSITVDQVSPTEMKSIAGIIELVQMGKDGYTAKLNSSGQIYYLTVSRANLLNPQHYRSVVIGDSLSVTGDMWKMERQQHLTVREIIK